MYNIDEIRELAESELKQELFRNEVDKYKEKLKKQRSMWDIIFPFKIIIIKKEL